MAAKSQEKIIFGVALLGLVATAAWIALEIPKLNALRNAPISNSTPTPYVPTGVDAPTVSTSKWPSPTPQTRGLEWIYDVFTPPEIYYTEATKEFTVTPPSTTGPVIVIPVEKPFGVELTQVKQDVFRLQLVGYVGKVTDALGTFENTLTGETLLARAGKKFPALGLTVRTFEVQRKLVPAPDSMPIYETVATAVVVDDKTNEEITLTNKTRVIKGTPIAVLKVSDSDKTFEQKAATSFMVGLVRYTVLSVKIDPATAEVRKESSDPKTPAVTKPLTIAPPVTTSPSKMDSTAPVLPVAPAATATFPFGN